MLGVLQHALSAMLLAIHHLDYHTRLGAHEGKPQLLLMHRYFFALAVELASQTSIICVAMCDAIPGKLYPCVCVGGGGVWVWVCGCMCVCVCVRPNSPLF